LRDGTLDVSTLENTHKGLEEQLQQDADSLRALKDQNTQVHPSGGESMGPGHAQHKPVAVAPQ
jgi:hypothetical protein